jgi:RNA polymerase sigma factor FliA
MLALMTTQPEREIHAGNRDRDQLIHGHLDMARRLARKVSRRIPPSITREELESAALLGLTEAASRFDAARGEPFVAYAAKRIRGAVLDELRRHDVLTRRGRQGARRLADAKRAVELRIGAPAEADDVADELGISTEEVAQARGRFESAAYVPLDDLAEQPVAGEHETPEELCAREQDKHALMEALAELPERDLLILNMYYQDALTLKDIGDVLGITESRVSQLRSRTLKSLRGAIGATGQPAMSLA